MLVGVGQYTRARITPIVPVGSVHTVTDGGAYEITPAGDATLALAFPPGDAHVTVLQGPGGGRTFAVTTPVSWTGGAPTFSTAAGFATHLRLTNTGGSYSGVAVSAVPPIRTPFPTTWTNPAATPATQPMNLTASFQTRYGAASDYAANYDALLMFFSAAMRARVANNDQFHVELCNRWPTDGPGGDGFRGFFELYGGFYIRGLVVTLDGADARALTHEFSHAIDGSYNNRNNPPDPYGVQQLSLHPTLVPLLAECGNNGSGTGSNNSEWFAELYAGKVRGDGAQQLRQVGAGTSGGTPQSRVDRFNTYINSLNLV